jgi:hypothetical protein
MARFACISCGRKVSYKNMRCASCIKGKRSEVDVGCLPLIFMAVMAAIRYARH